MIFDDRLHSSNESIFDRIKLMRECPMCSYGYKEEHVTVLDEHDSGHLVHITCSQCHNSILAMVLLSAMGMSSIGIITDLSAKDASRVEKKPPISEDFLLGFHQMLKQSNKLEGIILEN